MRKFCYIVAILFLVIYGCATVPKEVVELSYRTGEDIAALYESYDKLIHDYFEIMQDERTAYLNDIWFPKFLKNWMKGGELVAVARGEKIWSEEKEELIQPSSSMSSNDKSRETLNTIRDWVDYALYAYEVKEEMLLKPLEDDEKALRNDVKEAFQRVIRANATITAHLNSIRKVHEVQDEALEALNLKGLRDNINDVLIKASEKAASGLDEVQKADGKIDNFYEQIKSLTEEKTEEQGDSHD